MWVSVAAFCRDRVTSWVYIRSRTSDSLRVSSPSTSYSAVSTWSVMVDSRMVRTDAFSTGLSRSSVVDSSSSARHMIRRCPSVSTTSCHSASPHASSVDPRDMMNDMIAERSMTERSWSSASSGSRRYTLAASSTLEYGAQSCGIPTYVPSLPSLVPRTADAAARICGVTSITWPSTPLTKPGESSVDNCFASSTASSTATGSGTSSACNSSHTATRRTALSKAGTLSSVHPCRWAEMRSSMCAAFSVTPRATVTVYGLSGETSDSFSAKAFRPSATSAAVIPLASASNSRSTARLRAWCRPRSPRRSGIHPTQITTVARVHFQLVAGVDEQRHLDLGAGLDRRRLGARTGPVALQAGLGVGDLQFDGHREFEVKGRTIVERDLHRQALQQVVGGLGD